MNVSWITVVPILLITLAVLAEVNLLRTFLHDWQVGRCQKRAPRKETSGQSAEPLSERRRIKPPLLTACLAVPAMISVAHGQEPAPTGQSDASARQPQASAAKQEADDSSSTHPAEAAKSPFSLQLNFDLTNQYFYHGIIQENAGLILQPAAKLTINFYEHDDFKIDGILGTWNSYHGRKTGAQTHGDFTEYWYECDLTGGAVLTKGKHSLTTTYTFFTSPSDAYETVQELDFTYAYDDGDLLGKWAVHPYALLGVETGADASDGANSSTGTYLELGVAPGFSFDVDKTPIAISFPVSVGLSLHNYYQNANEEDDTFGFAQVGAKANIPLPLSDRYGKWSLNTGVSVIFLGDHTAQYNGDRHQQFIATVGLQLNF